MKDKILKILEKYSEEVDIKGSILQEKEREDWMWSGMYEKVADELINSLSLGNVINQRELLIAFYKHLKGNYNTEKMNLIIDHFFESN